MVRPQPEPKRLGRPDESFLFARIPSLFFALATMPKATPQVTLAVPVYNCAETLPRCLDSLLAQSFQNFEIIIGDNHSTDETPRVAREYAARDERISYIRHERNQGFTYNFNHLIGSARGRYFMATGAKDWRPMDSVELSLQALDADASLALCYGKTIGTDGASEYEVISDDLDSRGMTPSESFEKVLRKMQRGDIIYSMIRLDAFRRTRLFRNVYASDHILMAELGAQGAFIHLNASTLYRCEPRQRASAQRTIRQMLRFVSPDIGARHYKYAYSIMLWEHLLGLWHTPLPLHKKFSLTRRTIRIVRRRFSWMHNAE